MVNKADLIIVNYNSKADLQNCIRSIREYTTFPYQIIVVDNNSTDGSKELLRSYHDLKLIALNTNRGYGAGANQGIRAGNGEYIFIMNPDLILTPGWLEPLVECLRSKPKAAVVGPKMLTTDGRIAGAGVVGTEAHPHLRSFLEPDRPNLYNNIENCVSVSGACYGIKRSLLPVIGLFDESFFMFFEETDYSYRLRALGYDVVYCPQSCIYHNMKWEQRDHASLGKLFECSRIIFEHKWRHLFR